MFSMTQYPQIYAQNAMYSWYHMHAKSAASRMSNDKRSTSAKAKMLPCPNGHHSLQTVPTL